ncbi:hypothetical protein F4777DRAFT_583799 [Nemania sp. FL0916]|nr:hypothetical protein F4777DRAFT_583799 [Nemania sp. FL0916]
METESAGFSAPQSRLLTVPLEIRQIIYSFFIPRGLIFDCSYDMYYQNRDLNWVSPRAIGESRADSLTPFPLINHIPGSTYDWDPLDDSLFLQSHQSVFPALLLTCRQITEEVEQLLYQKNTFYVNIPATGEDMERQFTRRVQENMRHVVLYLCPEERPLPEPCLDPQIWDAVLGNLITLGVLVHQSGAELPGHGEECHLSSKGDLPNRALDDHLQAVRERMSSLIPIFEYLISALPENAEIILDVGDEEDRVRTLEFFQKGPFIFRRLSPADSIISET